jgi:hypothetical protein
LSIERWILTSLLVGLGMELRQRNRWKERERERFLRKIKNRFSITLFELLVPAIPETTPSSLGHELIQVLFLPLS